MPQFSIIAEVDIEVTASTESEARRAAFSLLSSVKPAKQRTRKSKSSKNGDTSPDSNVTNPEPTSASITGIGLEITHPKPACEVRTFAGVTGPMIPYHTGTVDQKKVAEILGSDNYAIVGPHDAVDVTETSPSAPAQ